MIQRASYKQQKTFGLVWFQTLNLSISYDRNPSISHTVTDRNHIILMHNLLM